jgi:hypothetical protein
MVNLAGKTVSLDRAANTVAVTLIGDIVRVGSEHSRTVWVGFAMTCVWLPTRFKLF